MYKIAKLGLFGNNWLCWCGNKTNRAGFYPVNAQGVFSWHPFNRSELYACARCGRIIERRTMEIRGVTPNYKLSRKDLWILLIRLQDERRQPVGLELGTLITLIAPQMRRTLGPLTYHTLPGTDAHFGAVQNV